MKYDCDIILDMMAMYRADELGESSRAMVKEHLAECPNCKHIYNNYMYGDKWEDTKTPQEQREIQRQRDEKKNNVFAKVLLTFVLIFSMLLTSSYVLFGTIDFINSGSAVIKIISGEKSAVQVQDSPKILVVANDNDNGISKLIAELEAYGYTQTSNTNLSKNEFQLIKDGKECTFDVLKTPLFVRVAEKNK